MNDSMEKREVRVLLWACCGLVSVIITLAGVAVNWKLDAIEAAQATHEADFLRHELRMEDKTNAILEALN